MNRRQLLAVAPAACVSLAAGGAARATAPNQGKRTDKLPDGWKTYNVGLKDWNRFSLEFDDMEVFVWDYEFFYTNGGDKMTEVGAPGKLGSVIFGKHEGKHIDITATTPEKAQRFWGHGAGEFSTIIEDGFRDDNFGTVTLAIRRTPGR